VSNEEITVLFQGRDDGRFQPSGSERVGDMCS
jgi:hypothetical protein